MRIIAQRAINSYVVIEGEKTGEIKAGLVLLLGIGQNDTVDDIEYLVNKIVNLRIFEDGDGKMNESLLDTGGSILLISQFTLYANTRKGRRPSFISAAAPDKAKAYYELFRDKLRSLGIKVETGVFQADMKVHIINDGPVTIIMDTEEK